MIYIFPLTLLFLSCASIVYLGMHLPDTKIKVETHSKLELISIFHRASIRAFLQSAILTMFLGLFITMLIGSLMYFTRQAQLYGNPFLNLEYVKRYYMSLNQEILLQSTYVFGASVLFLKTYIKILLPTRKEELTRTDKILTELLNGQNSDSNM